MTAECVEGVFVFLGVLPGMILPGMILPGMILPGMILPGMIFRFLVVLPGMVSDLEKEISELDFAVVTNSHYWLDNLIRFQIRFYLN